MKWFAAACIAVCCSAQTPSATKRIVGEVVKVSPTELSVRTDAGETVSAPVDESTRWMRVPAGEKDLSKAEKIQAGEAAAGDRVLVRYTTPPSVIVMPKVAVEKWHEAQRQAWQERGLSGTVTSVTGRELTVSMRTPQGARVVIVEVPEKATLRRYAPESVKFADAKPARYEDLKQGDQIRVLGDAKEDGTRITAQQVVFGTFRNFAGTIEEIRADAVVVRDLESKRSVEVRITPDATIRRMPEMMARGMAARRAGAGAAGGGGQWQGGGGGQQGGPGAAGGPGGGGRPGGPGGAGAPGGGWQQRGGGQRPGAGDSQQWLERLPAMQINELKPGEPVIVAGTAGSDPAKATAIAVVAGVEPLLTAPRGPDAMSGNWNLDISIIPQ